MILIRCNTKQDNDNDDDADADDEKRRAQGQCVAGKVKKKVPVNAKFFQKVKANEVYATYKNS